MQQLRSRITYANVMSTIAVFLLLGGATAFAASKLGKNSVGTKQLKASSVTAAKLKRNSVTEKKVRNGAITTSKIKDGAIATAKIRDGAVTGAKVQTATLGTVPSAATFSGYSRRGIVRVPARATVGGIATTVAASPEVPLVSFGPFTIYAKCFDLPAETDGSVFVKTSEDGAIFEGSSFELAGNPAFLTRSSSEAEREVAIEGAGPNEGRIARGRLIAMAPAGTVVQGDVLIAVKNGTPSRGNGIYGAGNVCLFAAEMTALNG